MKKIILTSSLILSLGFMSFGQSKDELDTAKLNLGKKIVKIYTKNDEVTQITFDSKDTTATKKKKDEDCEECKKKNKYKGKLESLDFGFTTLLNQNGTTAFTTNNYLQNDPGKSFYLTANFFNRRLPIYKHYVGITSGFSLNWSSISIKNNQTLTYSNDSLYVVPSTFKDPFDKNKLRSLYLQVPLLLELRNKEEISKSSYLQVGVIGSFLIESKLIQKIHTDHIKSVQKFTGDYALNQYKLDATIRFGFKDIGFFTNYALTPLFKTNKTSDAFPLTFGMSLFID